MKAIFAVSALAAAISGQALAADTEATITYNGAMEFDFIVDMAAETKDVELQKGDDANDGGSYGLYMDVAVVNGPFSGTVGIASEDGVGSVTLGDIIVEDGPISFGQVGRLISTEDYAYDMGDANDEKGVDAALRYNVMEGFDVQLEGEQQDGAGNDYGVAAAYKGTSGDLSFVVDAQLRASDAVAAALPDASPYIYMGAGVGYETDMFTVKAGANNSSITTDATKPNNDSVTEYGVSVTATPVEGLEVGAHYMDLNLDADDDAVYKVNASFGATDAITLSGHYESVLADGAVAEIKGKLAYSADMIAAYAGATINKGMVEVDDALIEAGVSYTVESGIVYAADLELQGDATNNIVFSAAYSF